MLMSVKRYRKYIVSKSKWKKAEKLIGDPIKFEPKDLFQLRITENLVLPLRDKNKQLTAGDIPYRKFEQISEKDTTNISKNIVEEAYLYLENYSNEDSMHGTALYFITYPIIYKKKWKNTYNDEEDKFLNLSREIQVGFWERKSIIDDSCKRYNIRLAFKQSNHDVYLLKGL